MAATPRAFTLLATSNPAGGTIKGLNGQTIVGDSSGAWTVAANGTNQNITLTPSGTGNVLIKGAGSAGAMVFIGSQNTVIGSAGSALRIRTTNTNATGNGCVVIDSLYSGGANSNDLCLNENASTLFGTTINSSNGRLQLAAHTTSAGGIGFGTDTQLFRSANGVLYADSATNTVFAVTKNAAGTLYLQTDGTSGVISTNTAGASLTLKSGTAVTTLTLDASQNATFVGTVIHPAGTTALAPARFPHGAAPTSPTNGDFWTTTAGAFIRINGVTKTFTLT